MAVTYRFKCNTDGTTISGKNLVEYVLERTQGRDDSPS